jgi:hypothetical protein
MCACVYLCVEDLLEDVRLCVCMCVCLSVYVCVRASPTKGFPLAMTHMAHNKESSSELNLQSHGPIQVHDTHNRHTHTHTHAHTHAHTHTHIHTHTYTNTHTNTHTRYRGKRRRIQEGYLAERNCTFPESIGRSHTYCRKDANTETYIHMQMCIHTIAHMHSHSHKIHIYRCIYTHTQHTHTHLKVLQQLPRRRHGWPFLLEAHVHSAFLHLLVHKHLRTIQSWPLHK